MSIIMSAGNKKVEWSPKSKDQSLTKVASTGEQEVQERDDLFEAAKGVVEKEAGAFGEEEAVVLDIEDSDNGGFEVAEDAASEVSEEAAVETVEEAVEAVEEAVEDLKSVVTGEGEEENEIEIEVIDEEPVSQEGEIVIESEPVLDSEPKPTCCESCGATTASSGEEFVKYASISPSNRKKLRQYWKGMLNYVPDYVDLMTK